MSISLAPPPGAEPPTIFAIDPGTEKSGYVVLRGREILAKGIEWNAELLHRVRISDEFAWDYCAIEMVQSFGMAVGQSTFRTILWAGRFFEAYEALTGNEADLVYRKDVKIALCGSLKAKDSNIRQAILDRYGSEKRIAVGLKASPGPLFGVTSHAMSALAVALTFQETL